MKVIKEIEILGFKSFNKKTKLSFKDDLIAIVGPNGCGKSNILDAIKWVLGESSVKSIRGDKMEDIIFSGSSQSEQANFAKVSILLNNEAKIFTSHLDLTTIKISRILYRDGQSQYLINDKKVRKADIEKLLLNTGLGKSSYSFIAQNQIDFIISSKPEERRILFEEAGKVSKYKLQQEQIEKNLFKTQQNTRRLKDILSQLEKEQLIKKEQSEKTKVFNTLSKNKKKYQKTIDLYNIFQVDNYTQQLEKKLQEKKVQKEKKAQQIIQLQETKEQIDQKYHELIQLLHTQKINYELACNITQESKNKVKQLNINKTEVYEHTQSIKKQLNTLLNQSNQYTTLLKNKKKNTTQLSRNLKELTKKLDLLQNKIETNKTAKKETISRIEKEKQLAIQIQKKLTQVRNKQKATTNELLLSLQKEKSKIIKKQEEKILLQKFIVKEIKDFFLELENKLKKDSIKNIEIFVAQRTYQTWLTSIKKISEVDKYLKHILFDEKGIHSTKEKLENEIIFLEQSYQNSLVEQTNLDRQVSHLEKALIQLLEERTSFSNKLAHTEADYKNSLNQEQTLEEKNKDDLNLLNFLGKEVKYLEDQFKKIMNEKENSSSSLQEYGKKIKQEQKSIDTIQKNIDNTLLKKKKLEEKINKEQHQYNNLLTNLQEKEVHYRTRTELFSTLQQNLYNDFDIIYHKEKSKLKKKEINITEEKLQLSKIEEEIKKLGTINPLATQEFKIIDTKYKNYLSQLEDIETSNSNIQKIINDINNKASKLFLETFNTIKKNFEEVFSQLFNGGHVQLSLQNPDDPLNNGIDIFAQPPGKRPKSIKLLSGGEKALTAIALMFSMYLVNSSPFCILDEVDAPLDDANLQRFLRTLNLYKDKTQFIFITHNKKTMQKVDSIYGVTMENPGESKILLIPVKELKNNKLTNEV